MPVDISMITNQTPEVSGIPDISMDGIPEQVEGEVPQVMESSMNAS